MLRFLTVALAPLLESQWRRPPHRIATLTALTCAVFLWQTARPGQVRAAKMERPNVIFILADDLGWSDTTLFGTTQFYVTPNIERLARRGMLFRSAYSASPLCSPTRASILTGLNPARIGITSPDCHLAEVRLEPSVAQRGPATDKSLHCASASRLKTEYYTLAEALHDGGYATGHFGKWHLGAEPYDPLHQGFDVDVPQWHGPGPAGSYVAPWRFPAFKEREAGEHIEDRMGDEAIAFMTQHKDQPFLLNYWQFSVHAPFDAKQSLIDKHRGRVDPNNPQRSPTYAAMVESLDDNIGKILDTLDQLQLADRTIIVFFSDNGGNMYDEIDGTTPTSNVPLRGGKATMFEGGTRVPCIVCWPGVVEGGSSSEVRIQSVDFYPTVLEMLGLTAQADQQFDGMSIVPALKAEAGAAARFAERPTFTFFPHAPQVPDYLPPAVSVHQGDWKLIRIFHAGEEGRHRYELYNLRDDIGERNNLAASQLPRVGELDALIEHFLQECHAVVPRPNPDYDPAAVTMAQYGITGIHQCKLTLRDGQLHVESTGGDPHFVLRLDQPAPAGTLTVQLRMKSLVPGSGHVFWQEQGVTPSFHRSRRIDLNPIADDAFHDYEIELPAQQPVIAVRLDPTDRPGMMIIESLRLVDQHGDLLKQWEFDGK